MKYRSSPIKNILFGVAILGGILFFMIKKGFLSIDLNHERENPHITVQAPTTSEELPIIEKLNAYTFGVNRMAFRTRESYERYRSWVDMETGPTGKERHIYGLYKLYNLQPVLDRYNQAKAKAPRLPELERAGTAYVQALHSLALLAQEAMDYYDQKDYLDDEMALGKAIHSGLKENFDVYFEAEKKLRTRLVHYHTEQKNELLEQAENQGNPMLAQAIKSVDASSELLTIVNEEELFSIDVERLSVEIEKVKTEWKALQGLMDGQTLGYAEDPANDFLKSAKELMRRVRDQRAFSQSEKVLLQGNGAWMVEGSKGRLIKNYNQLIGAYNTATPIGLHYLQITPPKNQ